MHDVHARSEQILAQRVSVVAEELSSLLSIVGGNLDVTVARALVFAAMRDPELYAVKVAQGDSLLEGQRRGIHGALEPWDGVLNERTVQAIRPIESDSGPVGTVEVYLRVDQTLDFVHAANVQEMTRFLLSLFFSTGCYLLYLCSIGELATFSQSMRHLGQSLVGWIKKFGAKPSQEPGNVSPQSDQGLAIDLEAARILQKAEVLNPNVTAVLFFHVFAHTPQILTRLVAEENTEALQHLVGLLEQAAPCVGAFVLQKAAHAACQAIERGENLFCCEVEACILALENVLKALQSQR